MESLVRDLIVNITKATSILNSELIQELWSGYGQLWKVNLQNAKWASVIVKHIAPPNSDTSSHPRGWNTDKSHQRKLKSYQVELNWYRNYSKLCDTSCRVPACYGYAELENRWVIVLEDLDAAGFPLRKSWLKQKEVLLGLRWLACFHARFMGVKPEGLWEIGTYWHLGTRPDELLKMDDKELKHHAAAIDKMLSSCEYQTLVHGDAKVANFCFEPSLNTIAAVDFQYVGGGCGMKDVIYFLSSCLDDQDCKLGEDFYLNFYFEELHKHIAKDINFEALEKEWRKMYAVAWTDFYRFLSGWMPGHWKMHSYSSELKNKTLKALK